MKYRIYLLLLLGASWLGGAPRLAAQTNFSIPWFVQAAGGGTTSGGNFLLSGTFGQWESTPQPLSGGSFSLTGGFWSQFSPLGAPFDSLFFDGFDGNGIDPLKWIVTGQTVLQTNGIMEILTTVADGGGVLTSIPFAVQTNGLITITRGVYLHAQPSPNSNYPGAYFLGQFAINLGALPQFSVYYADFNYADGVTYTNRVGFFLARDGASPVYLADAPNISPAISPIFDTWFAETITYDPASGVMDYYTNNVLASTFNVGALPPTSAPTMTLTFTAAGWFTGHEQFMTNLAVVQVPEATNPAPAIALSGDLTLGGVDLVSNLTPLPTLTGAFTISNAGSATLTIAGVSFPGGFSGSLASNSIPPGGTALESVTFAPTIASNYTGVVTVTSDALDGVNTIPISAFAYSSGLTVLVNGSGSVSPNLNGKPVVPGRTYHLRALPTGGNLFSHWGGSTNSTSNPLAFTLPSSGALLEAYFVPGPFAAAKGPYNGLFSTTNGVSEETSGMLKSLTVAPTGHYSGILFFDGVAHGLAGTFSAGGQASNYINRPIRLGGPAILQMTLDSSDSPPHLTGTVTGTNNGAPWLAALAAYPPTNHGTGQFTVLLAPTYLGLDTIPPGYGYLLVSERAGVLTLAGAVADGTLVNQTVPVDVNGNAPVFASLYGNSGLLTGWLNFSNNSVTGSLDWIKHAARTGLYRGGFTNTVLVEGAAWTNNSPAPALDLPMGQLTALGGALTQSLTFDVSLNAHNALIQNAATASNSLSGTVNPRTGLLTVTLGQGLGHPVIAARGAALQDSTNGAGYFLSKTNSGSILLTP